MTKTNQRAQTAREFSHLLLELRDQLRRFIQQKFRENNIDLTYEMQQIMSCLWKEDGMKQQELADKTLKDKTSLTYLIDNLSKRGLVTRLEDKNDRRSKLIYLTTKGIELGKKVEPWVEELYQIVSHDFKLAEIKESIETVQKMIANVKEVELPI
ncbi:MAG TPA: MarR family transcriptional regulator [Hanamia sp.]